MLLITGARRVPKNQKKTFQVTSLAVGALKSTVRRLPSVFMVLVRPSRYSYTRLEEVGDFTVNVPPRELAEAGAFCGTVSGRDHDKFMEKHLALAPGRQVRAPIIQECVMHYECRTLQRNDLEPDALAQAVQDQFYSKGDYHRVYFGEIVASYADEDASVRLGG